MIPTNPIRTFLSVVVAGAFCSGLMAKELIIPTLPSAAQSKAVVISEPQAPINLADYGVDVDSPAVAATGTEAKKSQLLDTDLVQVSGGGRGNDIQKVPSSIARTDAMADSLPVVPSYQEVVVEPGVNTIIPAAINHLNRIVTPFENPIVQTVSSAQIKVKDNVIYVSTQSKSPVTMYITPKDDESVAISLTLAPREVPPIQAKLILGAPLSPTGGASQAPNRGFGYSGKAKKWEENQPYMDSIKGIMRALALGQIPKGYSIGKASHLDTVPACYQDGIDFNFSRAQIVMGHNFKVVVGVVRNGGREPTMFDETSCTHPTLAATAVWPRNMLEPGDTTEVYVITRTGEAPAEESTRPSLLN